MRSPGAAVVVWIRNEGGVDKGRLEREVFGYTPFADVPESPFYVPSPGSFHSARAWLDRDGIHVVMAHDCTDVRKVHTLRWPTWQALDGAVSPSFSCDDCGLHAFVPIGWTEVSTAAMRSPTVSGRKDTSA